MFGLWSAIRAEREAIQAEKARRKEYEQFAELNRRNVEPMNYNAIVNQIRSIVGDKFFVDLAPETDHDRACAWRRIKIIRNNQWEEIVAEYLVGMSNENLLKHYIKPTFARRGWKLPSSQPQLKENRMTREEALKALEIVDISNKPVNKHEDDFVLLQLLQKLEALGLIKFDEPKKKLHYFKNKDGVEYSVNDEYVGFK